MADQVASKKVAEKSYPSQRDPDHMAKQEEKKTEALTDEELEEDDDDDEEPKLKYERIGNALLEILKQDAASCMAVHQKFLALGTHWGVVHVLDHQGNNIRNKEFPSHTTTVNQISIDSHGEYVASCSEDGRVVINGLYSTDCNMQQMFDCPIRVVHVGADKYDITQLIEAIALHPDYGKRGNRQYVIGVGEKLVLYEKGFLRNKNTVLYTGEGFIRNIKWTSHFIAWANQQGVEVYDIAAKQRIAHVEREHGSPRADLFRCNLCWKNSTTLLVAWADTIQVCVIKEREAGDSRDLPLHYVELAHRFRTDFYASGIAPLREELVILAYFAAKTGDDAPNKGQSDRPQLLILLPQGFDSYIETSTDALSVRGFAEYQCNHYHLVHVQEESLFYIVSPKDIVVAKPRDMDDHIAWLVDRDCFKEALTEAEKHESFLRINSVLDIGRTYLSHLIEEGKYNDAASMCRRILGHSKELWEEEVYRFAKYKQLKAITPYIPYANPQLSSTLYEMILNEYLQKDPAKSKNNPVEILQGFQALIKEWPSDLYRPQTIIWALKQELQDDADNSVLLQTLGTLYAQEKRYDKGLAIYMKLGHNGVFDMIHQHNLLDFVQDKIVKLMEIDTKKAVKMLIDNLERISIKDVVRQLKKHKNLLHVYLDALFNKDPLAGQDFHELQVELYAEFDRPRLLKFLRESNYFALEKAFQTCEAKDFIPEMVYLLGRMGNNKKALSLILSRENDIKKAIEFAKEQSDEELWQDLISHSLDKPNFIKELLLNIGTHVDPIKLIKRIKAGMEIPGLRDSLVKILQDYNLQVSLHEGCKTILDKDSQ